MDTEGDLSLGDREQEKSRSASSPAKSPGHEHYQIIDYFRSCQDKGALLAGFLQFVRPCFATVAVFSVQSKGIKYLDGHGDMLHEECRLHRPIHWMDGVLIRRTIMQRMPYQGAIPVDRDEKQMFAQFLQSFPSNCWLYPEAIGDGVDCLVYADTPTMAPHMATQRLEYVIGKMVLAMRRLLVEHLLVHG